MSNGGYAILKGRDAILINGISEEIKKGCNAILINGISEEIESPQLRKHFFKLIDNPCLCNLRKTLRTCSVYCSGMIDAIRMSSI